MSKLIIQGGIPLSGTFTPLGNKNAVLPMLAACVLTDQTVTLRNVPLIEDVKVMLELLNAQGVDINVKGHTVTLNAESIQGRALDRTLCRKVRSSILLAGPLTARHGAATLYPPGGDIIGRRRVDTHFDGLAALGIDIRCGTSYRLKRKRLKAARILLDEASVTATENIMMAAALAPGQTILYNAACEPHVQDLGHLLNKMGASIQGLGTNRLVIQGVKSLSGASHTVQHDYIEVGSFAAAAAATGGSLLIKADLDPDIAAVMKRGFRRIGIPWQHTTKHIRIDAASTPYRIQSDLGAAIPKLEDGPWPAFPSDLMSVAIVCATQAEGTLLFFEKMFESRMYFIDSLISMGARIVQCDPHRVLVTGPAPLQGAMMASPDIRAGMALLIAACCAKGESVIGNAAIIDRGYEKVDERLRSLGAKIERAD